MNNKIEYDLIVVGGGPAGIMAAGTAASRGKRVVLIEKKRTIGKKMLISGKGRCNLTSANDIDVFMENFSKTGIFLRSSFSRYYSDDLMRFFRDKGLKLKVERGKRVFPESGRAIRVLNLLFDFLKEGGVNILLGEGVVEVLTSGGNVLGVKTSKGSVLYAENVLICTGGVSYPGTGSTGDGYRFASKLGHNVVSPKPALVPIIIKEKLPNKCMGISLKNVSCSIFYNGKRRSSLFGEMLFTHFGVSGPIILDLSADLYDIMEQKGKEDTVEISINFKPALTREKINNRLLREFSNGPNKSVGNIFINLLPKKLIDEFLAVCDIEPSRKANSVTKEERKRIVERLTDFRLKVAGTRPIAEAIITRGGVSIKEINPKTMESKIVKGLYFAGEVIDVDAKTGGYNMQAAFSTGYVCGISV